MSGTRQLLLDVNCEMTTTFSFRVTNEQIDVLRARLLATRWPSYDSRDDWSLGTSSDDARRLAQYWATLSLTSILCSNVLLPCHMSASSLMMRRFISSMPAVRIHKRCP